MEKICHGKNSFEERAEFLILMLAHFLDKLFVDTDRYSEEKEQLAEKMIINVFAFLAKMFDQINQDEMHPQAKSA